MGGPSTSAAEAHDNPTYRRVMEGADLVTPDGMPLVWGLGLLGVRGATRVYGPDLTPILCRRAAAAGIPVGFYGSTPQVLADLTANLARRCPGLRTAYAARAGSGDRRRTGNTMMRDMAQTDQLQHRPRPEAV